MEEVLVEVLLGILSKDSGNSGGVELGTSSTTQHLEDICQVHVLVPFDLGIVVLRSLDDNEMGREIDTPGESACGDKDLDLVIQEQLFSQLPIRLDEAGVVQSYSEADCLLQRFILDSRKVELKVILLHVQEPTRIILHSAEVDQVLRRESCLSSGGYKDNYWLVWTVRLHREECWPVHGLHQWTKASNFWEPIDVQLQRYWSYRVPEVEQAIFDT